MVAPTSEDLGRLIGRDVDTDRAEFILTHLGNLALSYVAPMTDAAWSVVLLAAVRLYVNAAGAQSQVIGPESAAFTVAGVNFTRAERSELKRLGGKGGAFTVDPTPADAGQLLLPMASEDDDPLEEWS